MNVVEILIEWLEKNDYDGLYVAGECACTLDDMMPCDGEHMSECEAGYMQKCDCGDHDYHIGGEKQNKE